MNRQDICRRLPLSFLTLPVFLWLLSCGPGYSGPAELKTTDGERPADTPIPVQTVVVQRKTLPRILRSSGTVVCLDRHTVSAGVGGTLEELPVLPGQKISAGEVIARIDVSELRLEERRLEVKKQQLQNDLRRVRMGALEALGAGERKLIEIERLELVLQRAKRSLERARLGYSAAQKLHSAGGISGASLEESRLELLNAEEQVADSTNRIAAARIGMRDRDFTAAGKEIPTTQEERKALFLALQEENAELEVSYMEGQIEEHGITMEALRHRIELGTIRSPADGFITTVNTTEGARLDPGDPLCSLLDPTRLFLRTDIPESALSRIRAGMPLRYSTRQDNEKRGARVLQISPEVDHLSKSVPLLCELSGEMPKLRPGEYVEIEIETGPEESYLSLPDSTLLPESDGITGRVLFLRNGRVFRSTLGIEVHRGHTIFFTGEITEGTEVVAYPPRELREGTPVTIMQQSEDICEEAACDS